MTKRIRAAFPALKSNSKQKSLCYFDSSSTTLKPWSVIKAIDHYYVNVSTNIKRGECENVVVGNTKYNETKLLLQKFLNISSIEEIIFTSGTTHALNQIYYGLESMLKPGDEIITSYLEHSSNILPLFRLAKLRHCKIKFIDEVNKKISWKELSSLITKKTKLVSLTYVSNIFGFVNDLEIIGKNLKKLRPDIFFVIDAAQAVAHIPIDVQKLHCDFLCFSAHKMYGPTGIGVLFLTKSLHNCFRPLLEGGGNNVSIERNGEYRYVNGAGKFEAGTLDIAGIFGFHAAIQFLNAVTLQKIAEHEKKLRQYAIKELTKIKDLEIYNLKGDIGIILFNIKNVCPQDVATQLGLSNICLRAGQHCNRLADWETMQQFALRLSIGVYNDKADIDKLVQALKNRGDCLDAFFQK